jgi:hypothetical protein
MRWREVGEQAVLLLAVRDLDADEQVRGAASA